MRTNFLDTTTRLTGNFWQAIYFEDEKPVRAIFLLGVRLGLIVAFYFAIDRALWFFLRLDEGSYVEPTLLFESFKRIGLPLLGVGVLGLILLSISYGYWRSWREFQDYQLLRALVCLAAFLLAWWFASYDVNLFFGQVHLVDRLLLVGLALLTVWRPGFVLPFLLVLVPIASQFFLPFGGYSLGQPLLLLHILMLFAAWYLISIVSERHNPADFIFLTLCLLAASYFVPGLGKIQLNWATHGNLNLLLVGSYPNGWLGFLTPEQAGSLIRLIGWFDPLMVGFTLLAEIGAIIFLWKRATVMVGLMAWISMHIGIFFMTGIFFWTWIAIDFLLLIVVWREYRRDALQIFTLPHFLISMAVILAGWYLFRPAKLAWYDSPLSYAYHLVGVGESGDVYELSPTYFAPYDYQFTLGTLAFLAEDPHLGHSQFFRGGRPTIDALMNASTAEDIWALENEVGISTFDEDRTARFEDFIRDFVSRKNQSDPKPPALRFLQAPYQIWSLTGPDMYAHEESLRTICVIQTTSFYNGQAVATIRRVPIHQIDIPIMQEGVATPDLETDCSVLDQDFS